MAVRRETQKKSDLPKEQLQSHRTLFILITKFFHSNFAEFSRFTNFVKTLKNIKLFKGEGCKVCNFTGYKGRTGIHELLIVDEEIKSMLIEKRSTEEIKKAALKKGMKTLRQDAVLKTLQGITTIDEVIRVTLE